MPRQKPEVLAGMREPRANRLEAMQKAEAADPEQVQVPPVAKKKSSETLYLSRYPAYRVTITSPGDAIHPVTGQRTIQKGIVVVFKQGSYRNDAKDKATRRLIDETLQRNSRFGKPGSGCDYWLASDQEAAIKAKKLEDARRTLSALPKEVVEEFFGTLKKGDAADHALPPA
jgi:hypothetical protein